MHWFNIWLKSCYPKWIHRQRFHVWCDNFSPVGRFLRRMQFRPYFYLLLKSDVIFEFSATVFTARAYARAVLGVVILSVRLSVGPSVTRVHCDKTKWRTADILYNTKGQSLCYSDTKSGWSATPPSLWNLRSKWPIPFEKRRLRPISTHNVSTVGDSEKRSITTNIKSTTGFPTSHRWSAYVTPKCPKRWLKERFFRFLPERDYVTFGSLLSQFRLSSVCLSSVMLVHPTHGVKPFGKLSSPLCTLAILWLPCKILRR